MNADLLPPLHALPEPRRPLILISLPEHIEMLMPYEIEIILLPEPLLSRALHLPLELDDILPQNELCLKEAHEHPRCYRYEMLVAPRIPNEHSAVLPRLEHAHALACDLLHFFCELGDAVHS